MKTNKLSIYLIKEVKKEYSQIIKKYSSKTEVVDIGVFYFEYSISKKPSWLGSFFNNRLENVNLHASSARGVFLTKVNYKGVERIFAIPFGTGRHMLHDVAIEERFGLKITLNSVYHESIRSIEKRTLGAVSKLSKEQLSKASTASDFGIDVEQDLLKAVTGYSKYSELGKIISGADALSVSVRVDLTNLDQFLNFCLEKYYSNDYQQEFGWIDQIKDIKNH